MEKTRLLHLCGNGPEKCVHTEFTSLAEDLGYRFETFCTFNPAHVKDCLDAISQAKAIYLGPNAWLASAEHRRQISKSIEEGSRVLLEGTFPNDEDKPIANWLFNEFGIGCYSHRVFQKAPQTPTQNQRVVLDEVTGSSNEELKPLLTKGDPVVIQRPGILFPTPQTLPLLEFSPESDISFTDSDDFLIRFDGKPCYCAISPATAAFHEKTGGLALLHGTCFRDKREGWLGHRFPGTGLNTNLAHAFIRWMAGDDLVNWNNPLLQRALISKIEHNLSKIVESIPEEGTTFASILPEGTILRFQKRSLAEEDFSTSLNLIDYKNIITKNWSVLAGRLDLIGVSPKKQVSWIQKLNGIRNLLAHEASLKGRTLSKDEVLTIEESFKISANWVRRVC